ncbi:MAG: rhombosortase [Desulfobacteraceae bacterium]|nr:rhombosortase [Desulfobacteraceae bacterium]
MSGQENILESGRGWTGTSGRWETWGFAVLLVITNTHLLAGELPGLWSFSPERVLAGQWWRLLLHPFAHVSWYHLALDAGAFFILYATLREPRSLVRLGYVLSCGIMSLVLSWWLVPNLSGTGLCGLSGIAHGLTAVCALEMTEQPKTRTIGVAVLVVILVKSILEACLGRVLLVPFHQDWCGTPVAISHLGGVTGGVFAFSLKWGTTRETFKKRSTMKEAGSER